MSELRSGVKVEVAVMGLPVPNSPFVSVDVKATLNLNFGCVGSVDIVLVTLFPHNC